LALARSGCEVHFISSALPMRLTGTEDCCRRVDFHRVEAPTYPVFQHPPYTLSLATKLCEVAQAHDLDILHAHYAIPHAASAFLACEMLGDKAPRTVTTLHGTDITLVGQEPSFFPITRFVIDRSDAVTAVSEFLRDETESVFGVTRDIEVIPNFVDVERFRPREDAEQRARFASPDEKLLVHASNYRKVKNVSAVVEVFARVAERLPCRLLLMGDGPELATADRHAVALGVEDRVIHLGRVDRLEELLPLADLLLLPSRHESFGLVALEALACGTPVVATNRGGTREFLISGEHGFLCDPEDVEGMAAAALRLLENPDFHRRCAEAGRRRAVTDFTAEKVVARYLALYERLLADR